MGGERLAYIVEFRKYFNIFLFSRTQFQYWRSELDGGLEKKGQSLET
jgi:hypothetical protein